MSRDLFDVGILPDDDYINDNQDDEDSESFPLESKEIEEITEVKPAASKKLTNITRKPLPEKFKRQNIKAIVILKNDGSKTLLK